MMDCAGKEPLDPCRASETPVPLKLLLFSFLLWTPVVRKETLLTSAPSLMLDIF